jgi:hypothetical protein
MLRPVFIELTLFLTPFAIYALFLWATQAGVMDALHWSPHRLISLAIAALALMVGSFVFLAEWGGAPPGSTYVPAHVEDGHFVPGVTK